MTANWTRRDVNPITVVLEIAFGADVTSDPNTWVWTDVSLRMRGQAVITRGRPDQAGLTAPSHCSITLDNTDSQLSTKHPSSQWYKLWDLGTQMRLKVVNPTTGVSFVRCQGGATEIEQSYPAGNGSYSVVNVVFQGVLYLLGQGKDLRSPMYRVISADKPEAYWSMEDGKTSTVLAEYHGGSSMLVGNGASFSSGGPSGASAPVLTFNDNTVLFGSVAMSTSVTGWTVEFFTNLPAAKTTASQALLSWRTPLGSVVDRWALVLYVTDPGADTISLEAYNHSDSRIASFTTPFTYQGNDAYGVDIYWSISARQNGSAIQFEFAGSTESGRIFSRTGGSITSTLGRIESIYTPNSGLGSWTYGHISAWGKVLDTTWGSVTFPHAKALNGQSGDGADARITNMAAAASVPLTIRATLPLTITTPMGQLPLGSALAAMREAELADLGILTDGLSSGLFYLPRQARYNQNVALTLDANQNQVKLPFAPTNTDQQLRNSVTASRTGGSSFTASSPVGVNQGLYTDQVSLNIFDDSMLPHQANFRLNMNSVPELRVPSLALDLRDRPELIRPWLDNCDIGSRIQASHLPVQFPIDVLDYIINQYKETIDSVTWKVEILGSPFEPWRVFVVQDSLLGRLDNSGSKLASGVSATATSWSVSTLPGSLWTTTATFPADFPMDIMCEGEQIRVTAISGTSSPQTFTVTRSINGVVKAHTANAPVSLYKPAVLAL